ncbi:hypothetical protein I350_06722 [Cryptococcus amylolentus CBS 6273]|uniref:Fe2OG dioxygenase domain-containing protein n=1 Tax=Cryptococcus amylolentus CBS 6273 TaxID=1296118 RepID=A0A1E3JJ03_9TREE|nr:hypothetical protein I350_06722 [Cryptococcus amylolentus CBS 6273]
MSYQPPSTQGKPFVPDWIPPPATKTEQDWAQLHTIELSLLDSPDPKVVQDLVELAKVAIKEDGFLYLKDYGVSYDQLMRQFSIAQYLHANISEADKAKLLWDPETGLFEGYKAPYGWKRERARPDGISQFNFYTPEFEDHNKVPECILPFMDEITAFCEYLTKQVNRRLLTLLSKVLELPDDYLWNNVQSQGGPVAEGYFRHALFRPPPKETRELSGGLRMNGHTDYGTTTQLFSVPISCLQIWGRDEKWHYVKYEPGALVINIGETLEILSGGHFKATRHRVFEPPSDQLEEERLSLVLFNASMGHLRMTPCMESPLLKREGCVSSQGVFKEFQTVMASGISVPTNKQWREAQIASMRDTTVPQKEVEINGKKHSVREFFGVKVLLPV